MLKETKEAAGVAISIIRTVILYVLLVAAMRIMGKRQLGELQPSELVVTLLVSDLASVPMQDNGLPLLAGVLPILVLIAAELLLSGLMLKAPAVSHLIGGSPMPVIRDGRVCTDEMRRLRLTVDDLAETLRQQGIFDLRQVQYAIVETNGHISAWLYPEHQPATAGDVGAPAAGAKMPVVLVSDGRTSDWGLRLCGVDEQWLRRFLGRRRCPLSRVFLLTAAKGGEDAFLLTVDEVETDEGKGEKK